MKIKKRYRVILSVVLVMVCFMAFPLDMFAEASSDIEKIYESTDSNWKSLKDLGVQSPITGRTAKGDLSEIKYQSQRISTGKNTVGTIKMKYRTMIGGGRPQFAYDTVQFSLVADSGFTVLNFSDIIYTNDRIEVYVSVKIGLAQYTSKHVFKP